MTTYNDDDGAFEQLVAGALAQGFSGWDFSCLKERWREMPPPWDYRRRAYEASRNVAALLDQGTGGGEVLASLAPLPPITWATEDYTPNVPVAHRRLSPLGARVVHANSEARLPFPDAAFDLVLNRHSDIDAPEVTRVLKPGGRFITQQVGGRHNIGINKILEGSPPRYDDWTPALTGRQLEAAGLTLTHCEEAFPSLRFDDIGAVVFYLKVISWQIPDFSVAAYRDRLRALHRRMVAEGGLEVRSHYFLIEAEKGK